MKDTLDTVLWILGALAFIFVIYLFMRMIRNYGDMKRCGTKPVGKYGECFRCVPKVDKWQWEKFLC